MPLTKADFDASAAAWGKTMQTRQQAELDYQKAAEVLQSARDAEEKQFAVFQDVLVNLPPGTI